MLNKQLFTVFQGLEHHAVLQTDRLQEENQSLTAERDMLTWQLSQQRAIETQEAERSLREAQAAAGQLQAQNVRLMDEREQLLQSLAAARQQLQQQVRPTILSTHYESHLTECLINAFPAK